VRRAAREPEQTGAAQNAWRNSVPMVGQVLDVRRRNWESVGLHVAASVVRMEIEDVRGAIAVGFLVALLVAR